MEICRHDRGAEQIDALDEDMHCWGWQCTACGHDTPGECHHRTWCREDFCGQIPLPAAELVPAGAVS